MAAYAYTASIYTPTPKQLLGYPGMRVLFGEVNITNYNQTTLPEIVEITKKFKSAVASISVVCSGVSNGAVKQLVAWSDADKSFRCYVPTTGVETATDVNVGAVHFIAIGV